MDMLDLDDPKILKEHRQLIRNKKILNKIYLDFYHQFKEISFPKGLIVEIGSGAGFIKKVMPLVITSDVIGTAGIDKIFSAEKIPFPTKSVAAFLMVDVLHHLKDVKKALKEMDRCLKVGGKIVMIEPFASLWGGLIYKYFHHEDFNPSSSWRVTYKGRLSSSNTALPWIIFVRDRKKFIKKFPHLKIIRVSPHTPFSYLLSGGLSKPQLIPTFFYPFFHFLESLLSPFNHQIGMFVTIELEKI